MIEYNLSIANEQCHGKVFMRPVPLRLRVWGLIGRVWWEYRVVDIAFLVALLLFVNALRAFNG